MSILLFIALLSMAQSYISPLTPPALSGRTKQTSVLYNTVHRQGFGHASPFETVNPSKRKTALNATRKRDAFKKTYRKALTKFSELSQALLFSLTLLCSSIVLPANAASTRSGGRMGGSFSRSSRPSYSRSSGLSRSYSPSSSSRMYSSPMSRGAYRPPSSSLYYRSGRPSTMTVTHKQSFLFPMVLYGSIFYVNYQKRKREGDDGIVTNSPLGPGISVVKFSIAMDLSDRDDPNGILSKLKETSESFSTESRMEVSHLISKVCKDLLQEQSKIFAACASYDHYSSIRDAERQHSKLSIEERSKFELETINKFGGRYQSNEVLALESDGAMSDDDDETKSTCAIVTILLSIEGDQTKPRTKMNSWQDVWDALSMMGAHVLEDDCLLSAEVLWTPERRSDVWTRRDIAAFYSDLRVI